MPGYECKNCKKQFKSKRNLDYHNQKKACKERLYDCKFCNRLFTTSQSMYRHMRTVCKAKEEVDNKKQDDEDKQYIYEKLLDLQNGMELLQKENEVLREEIKKNTKRKIINNTINGNTINNTNNGIIANNINNYVLVGYGKEDIAKINREELLKGIKSGFHSTINLIDTIHFNPEYPEFHNVYISSMKNKYAMMYDGLDWTLVMKEDLINKLYDDKRNYIEENLDDFLDSLTESQKNALHRWMDADDDHEYISVIKNKIKLLLYNKRKVVINTPQSQLCLSNGDIIKPQISSNRKVEKTRKPEYMENITDGTQSNMDNIVTTYPRKARMPGTKKKFAKARKK